MLIKLSPQKELLFLSEGAQASRSDKISNVFWPNNPYFRQERREGAQPSVYLESHFKGHFLAEFTSQMPICLGCEHSPVRMSKPVAQGFEIHVRFNGIRRKEMAKGMNAEAWQARPLAGKLH